MHLNEFEKDSKEKAGAMRQGHTLNKIITSLQEKRANVMSVSKKPTDSRHSSVFHLTLTQEVRSV